MTHKLTPLILALTLCSSAVLAQPTPRDPGLIPRDPGAAIGLPDFTQDPAYIWCGDALTTLHDAREQARVSLSIGDYLEANAQLIGGLNQAAALPGGTTQYKPLTQRAIARGPQLAGAVALAVASAPNGAPTITHFLMGYYDFIDRVADDLDMPYYIPYQHCRSSCGNWSVDVDAFESRFVQYAKEQVELVLSNLAEVSGGRVFPKGAHQAYLKALELVSGYSAHDLSQSLWAPQYACSILNLRGLSMRLAQFNSNMRPLPYAGNPVIAVNASYNEAQVLTESIRPNISCRR